MRPLLADDAAVSRRIVQHDRQQSDAVARGNDQRAQRRRAGERHVAVKDQRARVLAELGQRLRERVAGAQLRRLQRPVERGIGDGFAHAFAAMTVHDHDAFGSERGRRGEHVTEQRTAGKRMKDLGQVRVHALALTGGEDDDVHVWGSREDEVILSCRFLAPILRGGDEADKTGVCDVS